MQSRVVGVVAEETFVFGINIKGRAFRNFLGIEEYFPVQRVRNVCGCFVLSWYKGPFRNALCFSRRGSLLYLGK